jgi:hypothetical protein
MIALLQFKPERLDKCPISDGWHKPTLKSPNASESGVSYIMILSIYGAFQNVAGDLKVAHGAAPYASALAARNRANSTQSACVTSDPSWLSICWMQNSA